ncbi:hypothetical protein SAMN05660462_02612 [Proteiniborus ethanoligenes]|uniref:Uncharacterized protein n=1 Tax=Proteiniborus ethanoligenes TaxID=415015 RepID=A0A1H3RXK7_9FIRM|nr:hypothetical protein [Proteiniborus ethanoligenes]SDZ30434.1 hypothetical protein SAMN05660462_02612 [Proteiniborus ethanoligenes]
MYNDFISISTLATFAGLVAAVSIIVQFTKSIVKNKLGDAYVRLYTFIIALILNFVFARSGQGIQGIVLTVINAIIVSITSMGGYEMIADPKARKAKR